MQASRPSSGAHAQESPGAVTARTRSRHGSSHRKKRRGITIFHPKVKHPPVRITTTRRSGSGGRRARFGAAARRFKGKIPKGTKL